MSLTKRNGIYYAQRSIPADVRHIIGKSNFRQSTGCRDKVNAMAEAAKWLQTWDRMIQLARNEPDAVRDEIAVLTARAAIERAQGEVDEWGYTESEAAREGKYEERDWLEALPPSQQRAYVDIMFGNGVPLPHFMDRFIAANYDKAKAKSEAKRYILEATLFVPTLEQINEENARAWLRTEANKPEGERRALKTMQKATGYLSEYLLWLQDQRLLSDRLSNPFYKMRYPRGLKAKESYVPFSIDEIEALRGAAMDKADTELVTYIDIGRYTGLRLAEIGALSSESVETVDGIRCFRVKLDAKTKASAGRLVPISCSLEQLMPLRGFDLGRRENAVGKRFSRLKKTVLPDGDKRTKCFHSIRKFVVTTLEQAGVAEGVAADLVGHEKQTMTYGVYSGGSALCQLAAAVATLDAKQPLPTPAGNVIPMVR